jgi:hypothetical protein
VFDDTYLAGDAVVWRSLGGVEIERLYAQNLLFLPIGVGDMNLLRDRMTALYEV